MQRNAIDSTTGHRSRPCDTRPVTSIGRLTSWLANQHGCRRGVVMVIATFTMVLVLAFAALTVDLGYISVAKSKLQAACDAASLAAVMDLSADEATATATADAFLVSNGFDPADPSITRTMEFGTWDNDAQSFSVDSFETANAIRVSVTASSVTSFFGSIFGYAAYSVQTDSISLTGAIPRDIVLVIDCSTSMGSSMSNGQTRIENTRTAGHELVNRLNASLDRVGLAVYSWEDPARDDYEKTGHVEEGLNFDFNPTDSRISTLDKGEYGSGTNIGGGFRAGLDVFLTDPSPRTEEDLVKIVVMLTDGEVNTAEPYPYPNDGPSGTLPPPPYSDEDYDDSTAVTQWANTIKARGIKVYTITLGDDAYDPIMVDAASPPDEFDDQYYHHVPDGALDSQILRQVYSRIGGNRGGPSLVR